MSPKHVALKQAIQNVTKPKVRDVIMQAGSWLDLLDIPKRRIGVAALNPHTREGGILGKEEIEEIEPAVDEASEIIDVKGLTPLTLSFTELPWVNLTL